MKKLSLLLLLSLAVLPFFASIELKPLVDSDELNDYLTADKNAVVLDIRLERDYRAAHVPGSINIPYDSPAWRTKRDNVVGQIPNAEDLQNLLRSAGINQDSAVIVIYGATKTSEFGAAARVYWTLKVAGVKKAAILNGGFREWFEGLYPAEEVYNNAKEGNIVVKDYDPNYYADEKTVKNALNEKRYLMVDARPDQFFQGFEKHKEAISGGTLPESKNLSQFSLIDAESGKLLPTEKLKNSADALELSKYEGVISFCNTGHWAATNWFAFSEVLGYKTKLYDGSMVEWTANNSNPLQNVKNRLQLWYYSISKRLN